MVRCSPAIDSLVLASCGAIVRDKVTPDLVEVARIMVAAGRGRDLMPWGAGSDHHGSTVSAAWYLNRAAMHRELHGTPDLPPALTRVRCPILAWYGDDETKRDRDIKRFVEVIRRNATAAPFVDTRILPDLDFFYEGREPVIADQLLRWLSQRAGRRSAA